jgi:hypothetical protein
MWSGVRWSSGCSKLKATVGPTFVLGLNFPTMAEQFHVIRWDAESCLIWISSGWRVKLLYKVGVATDSAGRKAWVAFAL